MTLSVRDSAKLELLLSPELFALKVLRVFSHLLLFLISEVFFYIPQQSPQPTQNFWVHSEFLSFFVLHSRLLADSLSHLGKWVKSNQIWGWKWNFLHLDGWKTTRSKLRFLLRNTGVDSDFTQNFWGKIWRLKSLVQSTPLNPPPPAPYQPINRSG